MSESVENISIQGPGEALHPSQNFQNLRNLGLDAIIQTGSDQWTDYNEHDPGITILESLAYVLTDLAYRTDFSITDILAQQQLSYDQLARQQFYTARNILTGNPVTINDLRKTIIDQEGVDNAWLVPSEDAMNTFGGMLDVLVAPAQTFADEKERNLFIEKIERTYATGRALGQDIDQIIIQNPSELLLNLELIIEPKAVAEKVLAEVLTELGIQISNITYFLSLEEMIKKTDSDVNEIFNGPALLHGFIPDDHLSPMRQEWRTVDLIPFITAIENVVLVQSLGLRTAAQQEEILIKNKGTERDGTTQGKWFNQIKIDKNECFRLAPVKQHVFNIKKGDTPCELDFYKLLFELKKAKSQRREPKLSPQKRDLAIPLGRFRDIENYISIQQEFPQIYGLDPLGPPPEASEMRLGQIKQLQAYLLVFDQVFANYLAQLANLGQLFSWDEDISRTYFFQGLEKSVNQLSNLLTDHPAKPGIAPILENYKSKLALFREDESTFLQRRNRFLDHLLARLGQDLKAYTEQINKLSLNEQLKISLETKLRILNHYPVLSGKRGSAYNPYIENIEDSLSGVRQWVETLFDMVPESMDTLHFNTRFIQDQFDPKVNSKHVFSQYVLATDDGSEVDLKEVMRIGGDKENYRVDHIPDKGHHILLYKLVDPNKPAKIYKLTDVFQNPEKTLEVIDELAFLINKYNQTSERIYLVEHLLLRPTEIEPYFGLELLDEEGQAWMKTKGWYPKAPLSQIDEIPDPEQQFYYCIEKKNPCEKEIPDKEKSTSGNPVTKKIQAKFVFKISETTDLPKRYNIDLRFGSPGSIVEMDNLIPYDSEEIAQKKIDSWMEKLEKQLKNTSAKKQLPLWKPILQPWTSSPADAVKYKSIFADPYSFVVTVVIPDWPIRFQDKGFKKALERIISNECPAHLFPNILWLDKIRFQLFQNLYQMWWTAYLEKEPDAYCYRKDLMEFIMKNSFKSQPK